MYIHVAVCDDDHAALDYISQTIETLFSSRGHTACIDCFPRGQLLIDALKNGSVYQIYFLDIEMPGIDGLELADYINHTNRGLLYNIIYISNRLEKVFDSFRAAPLRFIRKQYFYDEIQEAVTASLDYLTQNDENSITLQLHDGILRLPLNSILYIESNNKDQIVVTSAATYTVPASMNSLERELSARGFIRIHRCYLLNCAHIYIIQQDSILLDNHESVPLSKRRRKDVKEALIQYTEKAH